MGGGSVYHAAFERSLSFAPETLTIVLMDCHRALSATERRHVGVVLGDGVVPSLPKEVLRALSHTSR